MLQLIQMKPEGRSIETFFNNWSPKMAYVLGYFAADGSMYKNPRGSCYVSFTSTDIELVELIRKIINVPNNIEAYKFKSRNWKTRYTLQIGSKTAFNRLLQLDFTPNKSRNLKFPHVPSCLLGHFMRGYFDGDGCIEFGYFKRKQRNNRLSKRFSFRLTSGSQAFLNNLATSVIGVANIDSGKIYPGKNAYVLAYSRKDMLKLYNFIYPSDHLPCLKRKRDKFLEGIKDLGL